MKVFSADSASFGGIRLRRLTVLIASEPTHLLVHEQERTAAYVVASGQAGSVARPLILLAEWGEPLGNVQQVRTDPESGEVLEYMVALKLRSGRTVTVTVAPQGTYWWNGDLCCTKRVAYALRDVQRGKRRGSPAHPDAA